MGTSHAGSAVKLSKIVARESEMETEDQDDPLLLEICHHLQKAAIGFREWAASVADDEPAHTWALTRAAEVLSLADYINPPKPCWPANVVPFVPRRVG